MTTRFDLAFSEIFHPEEKFKDLLTSDELALLKREVSNFLDYIEEKENDE